MWKTLAPLIAAPGRSQMRLWSLDTDKFSQTCPLRATLPARPAAVYLYSQRRTRLLALDFDTTRGGPSAVDRDLTQAISWITQCGGVIVTDRSTSGGRHLLVPLAIGTTASFDEIGQLMRLLAARLPTLDINPNLGPTHGCLTPPGSPCKQGGYRQLDGALQAAHEAFTTRSAPDLLPRLYVHLGAIQDNPPAAPTPTSTGNHPTYTTGHGNDLRLAPNYIRHDPLPTDVHNFATHGILNAHDRTWPTPSEARMSVITHAVWRGHTLASITALIAPGRPWHQGLGAAYRRYRHHAPTAIAKDFTKALHWLIANPVSYRPPQHKSRYSQGGTSGGTGPKQLRCWLANGYAWTDQEFPGQRYRWTVHAVLQTLAINAARAGETINGTPVVGVGGRGLSLSSGLLSPDTMWRVLRDIRDRPGSPVTRIRVHNALDADWYALTLHNQIETDPVKLACARVEEVHEAWSILGHQRRRIYELIAHQGVTCTADIYAAAHVSTSTGNDAIAVLATAGLVTKTGPGTVAPGPTSLDAIAAAHHTHDQRRARVAEYRAEREVWRAWLAARATHNSSRPIPEPHDSTTELNRDDASRAVEHAYLKSVLATGPPHEEAQEELDAIEIIHTLLGARIIAA